MAIKKIANAFDHVVDTKRTLREAKLLRLIKHENVNGQKQCLMSSSCHCHEAGVLLCRPLTPLNALVWMLPAWPCLLDLQSAKLTFLVLSIRFHAVIDGHRMCSEAHTPHSEPLMSSSLVWNIVRFVCVRVYIFAYFLLNSHVYICVFTYHEMRMYTPFQV